MSATIWEIPVADRGATLSRRLMRAIPAPLPRDARPSRVRHERIPARLRAWGAASKRRD